MGRLENPPYREELRKLLDQGFTHKEIAEMFNVPRGTISAKVHKFGWSPTRERHERALPWKLAPEDRPTHIARMLRALGRRLNGGVLSDHDELRLNNFLAYCRDEGIVVTYDRDRPKGQRWIEVPVETVPEALLDPEIPIIRPEP